MRAILNFMGGGGGGKVKRQCPQNTTFEEKGESKQGTELAPSIYQPHTLLLGQTGSQHHQHPLSPFLCVCVCVCVCWGGGGDGREKLWMGGSVGGEGGIVGAGGEGR